MSRKTSPKKNKKKVKKF